MEKKYYGQHGEDIVLWSVFEDGYVGTYLDVGALDGVRFSNSYSFEQQGWEGICVEAHPFYAKLTAQNRPNATVIHAAVADRDEGSVTFHANWLGSLSTLNNKLGDHFKSYGRVFGGFKKLKVPMMKVDTILEENGISHVDVVSIDVEGTELTVLKGFSLDKYQPRILVVEAMTGGMEESLLKYMNNRNYLYARKIGNNHVFCRIENDVKVVRGTKIDNNKLIHVDHPLKDLIK